MEGISAITRIQRSDILGDIGANHEAIDDLLEKRLSVIGEEFPLSEPHDISWMPANDEAFKAIRNVISRIKSKTPLIEVDNHHKISREAALFVLKGVCLACQAVDDIVSQKSRHALCITRKGGNIEKKDEEAGYAILCNAAIAAHYALSKKTISRVAVVEFDMGPDRGTRHMVENNKDILMISVSAGGVALGDEVIGSNGKMDAQNYQSVVIPRIAHEKDIENLLEQKMLKKIEEFQPDIIFFTTTPGEGSAIWPEGFKFEYVSEKLMKMADHCAKGRYITIIEGEVDDKTFHQCNKLPYKAGE